MAHVALEVGRSELGELELAEEKVGMTLLMKKEQKIHQPWLKSAIGVEFSPK